MDLGVRLISQRGLMFNNFASRCTNIPCFLMILAIQPQVKKLPNAAEKHTVHVINYKTTNHVKSVKQYQWRECLYSHDVFVGTVTDSSAMLNNEIMCAER